MELWNNGTKIANFPGDRINTNLIMLFGTVTIYEVDGKGASIASSISYNGHARLTLWRRLAAAARQGVAPTAGML
jgi:hypothetical protein